MVDLVNVNCLRLHDVAKLFLGPQLVEELLFQQDVKQVQVHNLLLVWGGMMCEERDTAIIDIFIDVHISLWVNCFIPKFNASFLVD